MSTTVKQNELAPANAEVILESPLERLRALCRLPEEARNVLQPQIQSMTEQISALILDPAQAEVVKQIGGLLEWYILGEAGDITPEGLIFLKNESHPGAPRFPRNLFAAEYRIEVDGRIAHLPDQGFLLDPLLGQYKELGLMDELEKAWDLLPVEDIKGAVSELISESPTYGMFAAFDVKKPTKAEQPLNLYWRQVRERQVKQEVLGRHALSLEAEVGPGSQAYMDLRRGLFALDDETMRRKEKPRSSDESLRRAVKFVRNIFEEEFVKVNGEELDQIVFNSKAGELDCITRSGADRGTHGAMEATINRILDLAGEPECPTRELVGSFTSNLVYRLLDPRSSGELGRLIIDSRKAASHARALDFKSCTTPQFISRTTYPRLNSAWVISRAPLSEDISREQYEDTVQQTANQREVYDWKSTFVASSEVHSAEEMKKLESMTYGTVLEYAPEEYKVSARLVNFKRSNPGDLPPSDYEEDLVIYSYTGNEFVPVVPGYKLVTHEPNEGLWGYVMDPEGDPYKTCNVPIPDESKMILADRYREMGLGDLGDQLLADEALTVSRLVELLRNSSIYIYSKSSDSTEAPEWVNQPLFASALEELRPQVRDGKYLTQCTGASAILRLSLESVFGKGCTANISGWVYGSVGTGGDDDIPSSRISGVKHAQALFVHEDIRYILDATPPVVDGYGALSSMDHTSHGGDRFSHNRYQSDFGASIQQRTDRDLIDPYDIPLEEKAVSLLDGLKRGLCSAFDLQGDDQLYKFVTTELSKHDPAAVALAVLLRYTSGPKSLNPIDLDEIVAKEAYLEKCAVASTETSRKLGINHYSSQFLDVLHITVRQLSWAIQRDINERSSQG